MITYLQNFIIKYIYCQQCTNKGLLKVIKATALLAGKHKECQTLDKYGTVSIIMKDLSVMSRPTKVFLAIQSF